MTAFLDTNVLVYAQGDDAKGEIARRVILEGGIISVQVLNELVAVLRRKLDLGWAEIGLAVEDVRAALDPVRPIGVETHEAARTLAAEHEIGFYDGLIVAAAIEAGCTRLLTEDLQAGRRLGPVTVVNPFR